MFTESLRLAFGIVCVGVTLILSAHWLGLVPDATEATVNARGALAEAIGVNVATRLRRQQWGDLEPSFEAQVLRNGDLLSIGLRHQNGTLLAATNQHDSLWPVDGRQQRPVDTFQIPLLRDGKRSGQVEFSFDPINRSKFAQIWDHSLIRLLVFFTLVGFVSYTLCVFRILGLFNKIQIVPDRVRQALDTLAEGLLVLDEKGRIVLANQAFATIVNRSVGDLVTDNVGKLNWVVDDLTEAEYPWTLAIEKSDVQAEQKLRYRLPDGSQRIFSVNAAPLVKVGEQRGALATFRDVTHVEQHRVEQERMLSLLKISRDDIKRKNQELEILATQDALTGCLNRRAFFENFERVWKESVAAGAPLSCLMLDIDHFKSVNDTYGHHTGDDVLRVVAKLIRDRFSDRGLICRYGGEEFCIVLPHADLAAAIVAAEETRVAVMDIRFDEPADLELSVSIGVSELRFDAEDTQGLINQADSCLYVAKREGRNRVISFNASMNSNSALADQVPLKRVEIPYQAVTALVTALSYRDANTAEHSRRVADLCARAAVGLLDPAEAYVTEVAALLHDIGKIGVPDEILRKVDELTAEEWEVMGRYDRIGKELVDIAFDCPALSEVAACYQFPFRGTAGDDGVASGERIPVGARLLAIADTYDSITSDKCYRNGRSHDEAVEELRRCAGSQFDPVLVEHFAKRIGSESGVVALGAIEIQKQAAFQLGNRVEEIASAVTSRDADQLLRLANELSELSREMSFDGIELVAEKIKSDALKKDTDWISLIREAYSLMDLCRSTQSNFLKSLLEAEAISVNDGRSPATPAERGDHTRASRR